MRFFAPKPHRGQEAVRDARAGSKLHMATIVRLEGLGRAADAARMRGWTERERRRILGIVRSSLAVNTQLKGGRFLLKTAAKGKDFWLFRMALTGLEPGRLRGSDRDGFGG